MINQNNFLHHAIKKAGMAAAIFIIFAAVLSSTFRSLTPLATQYKGEVEQQLSTLLGQPVKIQSMETGWYWFHPVLKLNQVTLCDGPKSLHLAHLQIGINLLRSLWHWRIEPGIIYVDTIHLVARENKGHWRIDGLLISNMNDDEMTPEKTQDILAWLAQQDRLIIKHYSITLHLSQGRLIPISGLNLSIVNHGGYFKIRGDATLLEKSSTSFQLLANIAFTPYRMAQTKGQIYFSVKHLVPKEWSILFPKMMEYFESGKGDVVLWMDLDQGAISSIQAQVDFNDLVWNFLGKTHHMIQQFYANVLWKPNPDGWAFSADHIRLRVGGVRWPENRLLLEFNKPRDAYQLFVKSILIESLLSQKINWPDTIQKILPLKPHGLLTDTQFMIHEHQINVFMTRFRALGWDAQDSIPKVEHVSGALNWQPNQGRLDLDSVDSAIALKHYPIQHFDLINGTVHWTILNDALSVNIERFAIKQPELSLSTHGTVEQRADGGLGSMNLEADFAGKNLQKWTQFLPKEQLKPKLYQWLKNNIKRIGEANGSMIVRGAAEDFPFDNHDGEFSIKAHARHADIILHSGWPLVTEMEGYIQVINRALNIDLVHANFQGALVNQMNLKIDDIGNNRETLLIHGIVNTYAQKILKYILATPLEKKLKALKTLAMKGKVLLDLQIQIPLYPENDDNLVQGKLAFADNTVFVNHQSNQFPLEHVSGNLSFDEQGVNKSTLLATIFDSVMNLTIESEQAPKPYTKIEANGEWTIAAIKERLNPPFFSMLSGAFPVKALIKLTQDPHEMNQINVESSLKGLSIDLPAPLGKTSSQEVPFAVDVDFDGKTVWRFKAKYSTKLSTDLLFQDEEGGLLFQKGQLLIGSAHAVNPKKSGLSLIGVIDGYDWDEWKKVLQPNGANSNQGSIMDKLSFVDVTLSELSVVNQKFDNLSIKAQITANKDWAFQLKQKKIAADLLFQKANNTLSGSVNYLHIDPLNLSSKGKAPLNLSPNQIPNLNLRIQDFTVGSLTIGDVTLKSHSTMERWKTDYCQVKTPIYALYLDLDWLKKETINQTHMKFNLQINDLAKSLELWEISPAVDAGKGDINFNGGWNGALYDFSLAQVTGALSIELKNGIITHLSQETEGKLGLGKLLSILSLQTIPRRLKLDFSDLSHQGYSFDVFKGNFMLNQGIMTTQDSYVDGPVAYAQMKGHLDLIKRLYDLDLNISPHITASLPIVATIAGGPIVGVAAWVANKIINKGMQKISAYSYKISGPWSAPEVEQLTIEKKH